MKQTLLFPIFLFLIIFVSCNNQEIYDLNDNANKLEVNDIDVVSNSTSIQLLSYEGLWKVENTLGVKAILLTNGIIKEKEFDETSFNEISTYEECGFFTMQETGKSIMLTILRVFPTTLECQTELSYWGIYTFEIDGTQFLKIYKFNDNPLENDFTYNISPFCFQKVGDIYASQDNKPNNTKDQTPAQIYLEEICGSHDITLAYFWTTWSGPCRMQAPIIQSFVSQHEELGYCSFDADYFPELTQQYDVCAVPTSVFLDFDAVKVASITGLARQSDLELMYSILI